MIVKTIVFLQNYLSGKGIITELCYVVKNIIIVVLQT